MQLEFDKKFPSDNEIIKKKDFDKVLSGYQHLQKKGILTKKLYAWGGASLFATAIIVAGYFSNINEKRSKVVVTQNRLSKISISSPPMQKIEVKSSDKINIKQKTVNSYEKEIIKNTKEEQEPIKTETQEIVSSNQGSSKNINIAYEEENEHNLLINNKIATDKINEYELNNFIEINLTNNSEPVLGFEIKLDNGSILKSNNNHLTPEMRRALTTLKIGASFTIQNINKNGTKLPFKREIKLEKSKF